MSAAPPAAPSTPRPARLSAGIELDSVRKAYPDGTVAVEGLSLTVEPGEVLARVRLPNALPSIVAGLRLATVTTVALVTVGVVVGYGGLGQLMFQGFRNNFYRAEIMTATIACVLLALVLDLVLWAVGRLLTPWLRGRSA